MPEASTPRAQRGIAVDDDLRLGHGHDGDAVLEVECVSAQAWPASSRPWLTLTTLASFLPKVMRDLVARDLEVQAVDAAEDPEHEHVLAAPRVGHELAARFLERKFVDAKAALVQHLHRLDVRRDDLRVAMLAPHVLEQDRAAGLQLARANAAEQHLLVERDDEVGLVAAVGDLARPHADADAGGARDAARRRLDLGRDDLGGPDAVAHPGRDRAERLAAALRALAGIADHLDDVLGERDALPSR